MLPLAQAILDNRDPRLKDVQDFLHGAALFEISQVAEYMGRAEEFHEFTIKDECPWVKPPFPMVWFEYQIFPHEGNRVGHMVAERGDGTVWISDGIQQRGIDGKIHLYPDLRGTVLVLGADGGILEVLHWVPKGGNRPSDEVTLDEMQLWSKVLVAITWLNTSNRVLADHAPPRHVRRQRERDGLSPAVTHREIVVPGLSELREYAARSDATKEGRRMRLHKVRGHFKTVHGKRFWWRPFLRGNYEDGCQDGDYRVTA